MTTPNRRTLSDVDGRADGAADGRRAPDRPLRPVFEYPDGSDALVDRRATDRRSRRVGTNRARRAIKAEHAAERTRIDRLADFLTAVAGSTPFLLLHIVWFVVWIGWNTGLLGERPFDPFPFGLLTMVVSLEAIFLSIFVLMAQGRESKIAELREEITLQVNLRVEEEVTKTLQLVAGLYTRMGHQLGDDPELREMLKPLDAEEIERDLTTQIRECTRPIKGRTHDHGG